MAHNALRPLRRFCTIMDIRQSDGAIMVRCDNGDIEWLMGIARPQQIVRVGDRGSITYRQMGNLAGWFWDSDRV